MGGARGRPGRWAAPLLFSRNAAERFLPVHTENPAICIAGPKFCRLAVTWRLGFVQSQTNCDRPGIEATISSMESPAPFSRA